MANILHVVKSMDLGGTTKTAEIFCRELVKRGHQITVLYNTRGSFERMPRFQEFMRPERLLGYQFEEQGTEMLRFQQPDIVHVYRSGFPEWPHPHRDVLNSSKFVETNVFGFLDPQPVDKSLFMSEWLMQNPVNPTQMRLMSQDRFDFVYNPIDKPCTRTRMTLGLSPSAVVLGRCGRPDNGIYNDVNVQAARLLIANGFDVHFLVMAAPTNMVADLEKWGIPHTLVEPTVDPLALSEFYNTVDIYCHARADGETFGCNIAEAMMHGVPVVTHIAVPSNPQMGVFQSQTTLVDDGVTGFVVENNPHAYMTAVRKLLDYKTRANCGHAGREKAERDYATDVVVDKLEAIYLELLNG